MTTYENSFFPNPSDPSDPSDPLQPFIKRNTLKVSYITTAQCHKLYQGTTSMFQSNLNHLLLLSSLGAYDRRYTCPVYHGLLTRITPSFDFKRFQKRFTFVFYRRGQINSTFNFKRIAHFWEHKKPCFHQKLSFHQTPYFHQKMFSQQKQ